MPRHGSPFFRTIVSWLEWILCVRPLNAAVACFSLVAVAVGVGVGLLAGMAS